MRAALKAELKAELGGVRSLTDSNDELLRQELQDANKQLEALAAEREELVELKKQVKESEAELHREERSIELEKVRWQQQLSDALAELADAKATILKQGDKIRELERGYKSITVSRPLCPYSACDTFLPFSPPQPVANSNKPIAAHLFQSMRFAPIFFWDTQTLAALTG